MSISIFISQTIAIRKAINPLQELTACTEYAFWKKVIKCCMDLLCTWVKW